MTANKSTYATITYRQVYIQRVSKLSECIYSNKLFLEFMRMYNSCSG